MVRSDIATNAVPRAGVMVCSSGSTGEVQATLRMPRVLTDDESSGILWELLKLLDEGLKAQGGLKAPTRRSRPRPSAYLFASVDKCGTY